MNDESIALTAGGTEEAALFSPRQAPAIPQYLQETYWWAYLHPRAVWLFEREWLVNLILWGNMRPLTEAVLQEINPEVPGPLLQVACVYGDFSRRLGQHIEPSGNPFHIVDIAPIQLANAKVKLKGNNKVQFHRQDSSDLLFPTGSFAQSVVFFLLHEQPENVRRKTIREAIRVTGPGGKVIFVDYHAPRKRNPLRYVMRPVLKYLEPFALDMWQAPLADMMPDGVSADQVTTQTYCGGLYQKVVVTL